MKNLWKKAQKIIACALALAFVFTMSVGATESIMPLRDGKSDITVDDMKFTMGTIDKDILASLSIHKYSYDAYSYEEALKTLGEDGSTGLKLKDDELPTGVNALAGVTFKYYKVATLNMSTEGTVGLKYNVTNELLSLLDLEKTTCTSDELNTALTKKIGSDPKAFEKLVNTTLTGGKVTGETNENGLTVVKDMEQGLYLVIEDKAPATVTDKMIPFLVSLPMTNVGIVRTGTGANLDEYAPGTLWQYDVHVYPKNLEVIPDIEKNIVRDVKDESGNPVKDESGKIKTTEEKYDTASVGDTVVFRIKASIPKDIATMSAFTVVDTMSEGLTFKGVKAISVHESSDIKCEYLTTLTKMEPEESTDHLVLTWKFITDKINYLSGYSTGTKELVIDYEAVLNDKCVVAGMGNPNGVKLVYNHNSSLTSVPDEEEEHEIKSRVYTFGIDVTKVSGKNSSQEVLEGVKFRLYKDEAMTDEVKVVAGSVKGSTSDVNAYHPIVEVTSTTKGEDIVTGSDGHAYIWGLKPGTYYLKETETLPGYILLTDPIKVVIKEMVTYGAVYDHEGVSYTSATGTFYKLIGDNYVEVVIPEGTKVYNFGTDDIYTRNEDGTYTQVNGLQYAYVKAGAENGFGIDEEGTTVSFTVVNNSQFAVPQTGGIGTWMFTICGAVIVVAAVGLILIRRKKSMAK